jgi:hypothetical protein
MASHDGGPPSALSSNDLAQARASSAVTDFSVNRNRLAEANLKKAAAGRKMAESMNIHLP